MIRKNYFSNDTFELLFLLDKYDIKYLIVGGEASIYYGHSRLTGDIDIFYGVSEENVENVYKCLQEFWGGDIPNINSADDLKSKGMVFQFGLPPNRIDLLNQIEGVEFEDAWSNRTIEKGIFDGREFRIFIIGIKELIKNKETVKRPKDLDDLRFLKKIVSSRK